MGKYRVRGIDGDGRIEVESDFLPRNNEVLVYQRVTYFVKDVAHRVVKKEGKLEAEVEVYVVK